MMKRSMMILILMGGMGNPKAQEATGIQFEQGPNWTAILAKAKAEHKYIFVDCYATWCGPCKAMEQMVYPVKAVGDRYNKEFISVKLQMDRTPGDNDSVKRWYQTAKWLESTYKVNAYPTFLFFDPAGKPVHKAVGYKSPEDLIKLAADAQNPRKQYYAFMRNFRPGKLDTAEEKGLARSLMYTELGGQLAFDYLRRIPKVQLGFPDNLNLMMRFNDNPNIRQLAKDYINRLPEQALYNRPMLQFLAVFTTMPQDRGFQSLYDHIAEIDTVMKDPDWTQGTIANIIANAGLMPLLQVAKRTGTIPDFDSIGATIAKQYNAYFSERVIQDGEVSWYRYLVQGKKQTEYWPQLIKADIAREKRIWDDQQIRTPQTAGDVNDLCYGDIFQHSDDTAQLNLAVRWMKQAVRIEPDRAPANADELDTYACVLYKSGKIGEALQVEDEVLQILMKYRERGTYNRMKHTTLAIQRMWTGEKIWEEKEFQD